MNLSLSPRPKLPEHPLVNRTHWRAKLPFAEMRACAARVRTPFGVSPDELKAEARIHFDAWRTLPQKGKLLEAYAGRHARIFENSESDRSDAIIALVEGLGIVSGLGGEALAVPNFVGVEIGALDPVARGALEFFELKRAWRDSWAGTAQKFEKLSSESKDFWEGIQGFLRDHPDTPLRKIPAIRWKHFASSWAYYLGKTQGVLDHRKAGGVFAQRLHEDGLLWDRAKFPLSFAQHGTRAPMMAQLYAQAWFAARIDAATFRNGESPALRILADKLGTVRNRAVLGSRSIFCYEDFLDFFPRVERRYQDAAAMLRNSEITQRSEAVAKDLEMNLSGILYQCILKGSEDYASHALSAIPRFRQGVEEMILGIQGKKDVRLVEISPVFQRMSMRQRMDFSGEFARKISLLIKAVVTDGDEFPSAETVAARLALEFVNSRSV